MSLNISKRTTISRESTLLSGIEYRWYLRKQLNPVSDVVGEDHIVWELTCVVGVFAAFRINRWLS